MLIREVTSPTQFVGNLAKKAGSGLAKAGKKVAGAIAATEPFQKLQAISSTPGAWTSASLAGQALDQRERAQAFADIAQRRQQKSAQVAQQTQQRARELAQQWVQSIKPPAGTGQDKQPTQPFAGRAAPLPTVDVSGNLITKNKDGVWRGEDGRAVTDPAQIAKLDKAYYTGMTKQKGIVKEAPETTSPGGIIIPAGSKTDKTQDPTGFVAWADSQLASTIPGTRHTVTMDKIRKDATLNQPVKTALDRVLRDPANQAAVADYFEAAMFAMQQYSERIKQASSNARYAGGGGGGTLSSVISANQIQDLKSMARDPAVANQIKSELGLR